MKVRIIYSPTFKRYFIVHAKSGQNAFAGPNTNGFLDREDAASFATTNGATVVD